jgi:formyl-CoA transferase
VQDSPLAGTTVLDLSQAVTGPYTGWLLAGMGARVIKLEGPQGDQSRVSTRSTKGISPLFCLYNGGKEAISLNLKTEQGRAIFRELIPKVDVLLENFVPGMMEGWGFDYESLSALNPRLIYASVSGFGRDSKYRNAPALDMVLQAMTGMMAANGFPDWPPTLAGVLFIDTLVSPHVAAGIVAALYQGERTGRGQRLDIAMRDVAACIPFNLYNIYFNTGRVPERAGNLLVGYSPGNLYRTNDGYVYIACNLDKQAHGAFTTIGREDLIGAPHFATRAERWANHEEIDRIVEEWTSQRTKQDVFEQMMANDVPCGIVMDIEEVLNDDDLNARGVFQEIDQPGIGTLRLPRPPIVFGGEPAPVRPGAFLGEDNARLYRELLGYDDERLARLIEEGVITAPPGAPA